jgi:hypothetical protein
MVVLSVTATFRTLMDVSVLHNPQDPQQGHSAERSPSFFYPIQASCLSHPSLLSHSHRYGSFLTVAAPPAIFAIVPLRPPSRVVVGIGVWSRHGLEGLLSFTRRTETETIYAVDMTGALGLSRGCIDVLLCKPRAWLVKSVGTKPVAEPPHVISVPSQADSFPHLTPTVSNYIESSNAQFDHLP